jgi:hypothetical protein
MMTYQALKSLMRAQGVTATRAGRSDQLLVKSAAGKLDKSVVEAVRFHKAEFLNEPIRLADEDAYTIV